MKISVGIAGGAGYTGGELLRILMNHPHVDIKFVHSTSNAGNKLYAVHSDLLGETEMVFSSELQNVDALFLCLPHGKSKDFVKDNALSATTKIIDLSTDFRHSYKDADRDFQGFVYGLPELQRDKIKTAKRIANPGCFATAIQLALLPLAAAQKLSGAIHISAITGSTGAGRGLSDTTHFSWREGNMSIYKQFNHQHLFEIKATLQLLQNGFNEAVNFIPYRGNFARGILASVYTPYLGTVAEATELYKKYYANHPFVHIVEGDLDMKQVVSTNKCFLHVGVHEGQILIQSCIDNLLKGASGQAVQNFNILFNLEESTGLKLKSIGY